MTAKKQPEVADEVLMMRFQHGDAEAFSELVRRHKGPLYNYLLRHTASQTSAEDLLQDVLLRVVQHRSEFQHRSRFTTWVYTIARNLCVDHFRKTSQRKLSSFDQRNAQANPHGPNSVEQAVTAREIRWRLVEAVEQLPPDQREVFLLRHVAHLPFQQIATVTNTGENTVKSRMRYALERLQSALREYEDFIEELR